MVERVIWAEFWLDLQEFEHGQVNGLWGLQKIHTISHFIALFHTHYETIPYAAGPIRRSAPNTRSVFHTFLHLLSRYLNHSPELPQASWPCATLHTLYIRIRIYSLYTYTHSIHAAGPIANLLAMVKYRMDHKLLSLAVSIVLATIWYVIYVWLHPRAIGSLSGSCI